MYRCDVGSPGFFFSSRRRHTRCSRDWSSDVCSSDLAELDLARSVLAKEEAEFMRSGDAVTEAERRAAEAEKALQEVRAQQAPLREGLAGDRKSTRLNSSHGYISYAVFCL